MSQNLKIWKTQSNKNPETPKNSFLLNDTIVEKKIKWTKKTCVYQTGASTIVEWNKKCLGGQKTWPNFCVSKFPKNKLNFRLYCMVGAEYNTYIISCLSRGAFWLGRWFVCGFGRGHFDIFFPIFAIFDFSFWIFNFFDIKQFVNSLKYQ